MPDITQILAAIGATYAAIRTALMGWKKIKGGKK